MEIKNRYNGEVIYKSKKTTLKEALIEAVNKRANLYGANLYGADLYGADLYGADLSGADLRSANLYGANLRSANLRSANLYGADLNGADLRSAKNVNLHSFNICPEGSLIGWKKLACGNILKVKIPEDSKRINSLGSRKCRASYVIPVAVYDKEKVLLENYDKPLKSKHNANFEYKIGEKCIPDSFNDSLFDECSNGIHFFITFEEARDY